MTNPISAELLSKKCLPCEGGLPALTREQAERLLAGLPGWQLSADGQRIVKRWLLRNFLAGIDFFNRVGQVAEEEDHHPDLHLEGYRTARIELFTHAIQGLSENDFILAAKIERLPVELKS